MIEDWIKWPTKSSDPSANAAIAVFLVLAGIAVVVAGGIFLLPIIVVIAIAKGVHWYANRPTPTGQLAASAEQRAITAHFPTNDQFMEAHIGRLLDAFEADLPAFHIYLAMVHISDSLYRAEDLNNPLPPIPPAGTIEEGRYRDQLIARMRKSADAPKTLEILNTTLGSAYLRFIETLPPLAKATPDDFAKTNEETPFATFPLLDLLRAPGTSIMQLVAPFFSEEVQQYDLFAGFRRQFERNVHAVSGLTYPAATDRLVLPEAYKGTAQETVSGYLAGTPLEALFYAPIPFSFTDERRFEHMHIIGGSGHGKTQLLQHLILSDLQRPNPPALIVIDSQGEMLQKIQKLRLFEEQPERLIIIDPEQYSPALNMFDTTNLRAEHYSELHREQLQAGIIELYNYIFASIAAEMTSRQSTAFAFVARLLLTIPGATIQTLRELMEDGAASIEQSPFRDYIEKLEPTARAYFQNQFFTKRYADLKQQIARRLYGVLSVPAFDRMFSAPQNQLDMFEAMQSGKVVLVNTSKALLKSDASALFGRYMIALVIRAVYERVASPDRHPAFLFVDEASEYFDDNIQMLLEQARKFNVGLVLAHQHLDQLSVSLRSAIAANTAIKLAGGVNDRDARALAPDMRTSAEFISSMQKHARSTEFACSVRSTTGNALRLEIPFGSLEAAPTMSDDERRRLLEENRQRYAASRDRPRPAATSTDQPRPDAGAVASAAEQEEDWRS
jgi:hypothetical protein